MNRRASQRRKTRRLSKKVFLMLVLAILLVAGILYFTFFHQSDNKTITTPDGKKVILKPPTAAEKQASDTAKEAIVKKDEQIASNPNQAKQISLVITEANTNTIKGYVTGVFEDDGTCTATAKQDSKTVTKSSLGFKNVSYTQCAPISWDSPLSSGSWDIKLTYKSATAQGEQSKTIEVQ